MTVSFLEKFNHALQSTCQLIVRVMEKYSNNKSNIYGFRFSIDKSLASLSVLFLGHSVHFLREE
jgi:hypothetical protein